MFLEMPPHVLRRHRVNAAETWRKILFCIVNHNEVPSLISSEALEISFSPATSRCQLIILVHFGPIFNQRVDRRASFKTISRQQKKIQNTNTSNKSQSSNPSIHGVGTRINKYLHPASSSRPHYGTESGVNKATVLILRHYPNSYHYQRL
jgi:hypothetical protein